MVSLHVIFWMFIILFAIIGTMRGWARELLVTCSVMVALFILTALVQFVPAVGDFITGGEPGRTFWLRAGVILALVFFGYQTPNLPRLAGSHRFVREHVQDSLLGLFLGAINGFLIFGSIWYYLDQAGYPFAIVTPPIAGTTGGDAAAWLLPLLPPQWLTTPLIYFAVVIAFIFALVVFL